MNMKKAIRLKIHGTVQGVYFRQSTQQKARELNLSGWVSNTSDGAVVLEAEGEESALNELVQWCHRGPARAVVLNVEVSKNEVNNYSGFEVRR